MRSVIWNGVPWFDQDGNVVNAHGACIVREGDVYYLFGEYKTNDENRYNGFSCYSTYDFEDWRFEGKTVSEAVIDFYSAVPMKGARYVSPRLKSGEYVLCVTVLGESGEWFKKDGTRFGSKGCRVDIYGYGTELGREVSGKSLRRGKSVL